MAKKTITMASQNTVMWLAAVVLAFLVGFAVAPPVATKKPAQQQVVAEQNPVKEMVEFVDRAASLAAKDSVGAYASFRNPDGEWRKGDKYIFVYDMKANTLVLPPTPDIEGKNRWNTADINGVYFVREMALQLANKESAWVMYSYPRPGEQTASLKLAYVKKVNTKAGTVFVGSGIYVR